MKPEPIGVVAAIQDQERRAEKKEKREFSFLDCFPSEGKSKILSADHLCKLLKLGLSEPETNLPVPVLAESCENVPSQSGHEQAQESTEDCDRMGAARETSSMADSCGGQKLPKFTVPTWPIDPLHPFKGTDSDDPWFFQMYVVRYGKDVECISEIDDYFKTDPEEEASLGACFDLYGNEIALTKEERERNLRLWEEWMEERARKEKS